MLTLGDTLRHYKRTDVQEAILAVAQDKEVAVRYNNSYGTRPDVLLHENDVLEFAKKGAHSFHVSEEHWVNPLQLSPMLKKKELDELRQGWDLLLDIDCPELAYSQIAADLIVKALEHHDLDCTVKFSGNHGFHIAVPFNNFPDTVRSVPVKDLFPDGPKKIAGYLQELIRNPLRERLLQQDPIESITTKTKKTLKEAVIGGSLDPFQILDIDTVLIASRHLYRMPYSFNEKSGLVSIPVNTKKILDFDITTAKPNNIVVEKSFLTSKGDATKLLITALDHQADTGPKIEVREERKWENIEKVPNQYFPPCIQRINQGLKDGKKRATFILVNFLRICGWDKDEIEAYLVEWNKKNPEPLRDQVIVGQVRYHTSRDKKLPPNCANMAYMKSIGVCHADNFCRKIKNPANYAILKKRFSQENNKKDKKKAKKDGKRHPTVRVQSRKEGTPGKAGKSV
ncbi:hypothetical protein CMO91_05010 [Candidatus Woesearchaeota archaeon]|nr:hypothetical protein [Candidatus Woesearchaeota archaeon]